MTREEAWAWVVENDVFVWKIVYVFVSRHRGLQRDAEDYHVEAQIAAYETILAYDPRRGLELRSWVSGILLYRLEDAQRRLGKGFGRRRHSGGYERLVDLTDSGDLPDESDEFEDGLVDRLYAESVLLDISDETDREVVILHLFDGQTQRQIGERFGVSESRINQRYKRTIRKLQDKVVA